MLIVIDMGLRERATMRERTTSIVMAFTADTLIVCTAATSINVMVFTVMVFTAATSINVAVVCAVDTSLSERAIDTTDKELQR